MEKEKVGENMRVGKFIFSCIFILFIISACSTSNVLSIENKEKTEERKKLAKKVY